MPSKADSERFRALRIKAALNRAKDIEAANALVTKYRADAMPYLHAWREARVMASCHAYGTLTMLLEAKGIDPQIWTHLAKAAMTDYWLRYPRARGENLWVFRESQTMTYVGSGYPGGGRTRVGSKDVHCRFCALPLLRDVPLGMDYSVTGPRGDALPGVRPGEPGRPP